MVYLITGKKNIGKTTRLKELFGKTPDAWGFCSEKVHDCGRVTQYELTDLRTGDTKILARLLSLPVPGDFGEEIQHGTFRFAVEAFAWAANVLDAAKTGGAKAFFLDELGKLEIRGGGFHDLIADALKTDMDIYIAIRKINVDEAVSTFGITDYQVVEAGD